MNCTVFRNPPGQFWLEELGHTQRPGDTNGPCPPPNKQEDTPMKVSASMIVLSIVSACATSELTDNSLEAAKEQVSITVEGDERCIVSNGLPAHQTGPWREGASVKEQDHRFCVDATPTKTGTIARRARISGITITGIPLRPGTAEYYDAASERGYSRDPSSGWNVEGMGGLIMDAQNAHVDGNGYYHYHGVPSAVVGTLDGTLFGYAGDGFEIHYIGDEAQPSWRLKSGVRASGPGGAHDGTYVQDYEFVEGSGTLDECNGGMLNGQYVYFATNAFPFFPRCFKGSVSPDFIGGRGDRPSGPKGQ